MPITSTNPKHGFTLIEIMVSISIISILFAIGMTSYRRAEVSGRDAKRKQDIRLIAQALGLYYQTNKRYPYTDSTTGYWVTSAGSAPSGASYWLDDKGDISGIPSTPKIDFGVQYLSEIPKDPKNVTPYVYSYYSPAADWSTSCRKGKFYVLYVPLENKNDPDRYGATPYSTCGYSPSQLAWLNGAYAVIGGTN